MNTLTINGKEKIFEQSLPQTLTDLLTHLKINEATVVAEINGKIIERQDFASTKIANGQRIELVRFVGGG